MPKTIVIKGAYMTGSTMSIDKKKGAKTLLLNFSMKWGKTIAKNLGWEEPVKGQTSISLEGGMSVHAFSFEAGGKTFNLGSGLFKKFVVLVASEDGEAPKFELRGQYQTHMPGIMGLAEKYVDTTSRAQGELHLQYDKFEEDEEDDDGQLELGTETGDEDDEEAED